MTRPLLEATDVRKFYGDTCALDGVSLCVSAGELVSIIGPNGAGKTTLVNVLTGLTPPSSGRVRFKDIDVARTGPVRLARLGMARSFQLVTIFPGLSVGDTLAVAALSRLGRSARPFSALARDAEVRGAVEEVAALFRLRDKLGRPARTLPQGDKKLLDVASAFALHPEMILMDEPTSGVSTADKTGIMDTLVRAAERMGVRAIVLVEHDMDIVFGYSQRIIALHQGRVLADTTPAGIRADAAVVETVLGIATAQTRMEPDR